MPYIVKVVTESKDYETDVIELWSDALQYAMHEMVEIAGRDGETVDVGVFCTTTNDMMYHFTTTAGYMLQSRTTPAGYMFPSR